MTALDRLPRSMFPHGSDCAATFIRRDDTLKALIDVWEIDVEGKKFYLRLMKMRQRSDNAPWVFGSINDPLTQKDIWTFRTDARHLAGFKGDVETVVAADGVTTDVRYSSLGKEKHRIPFLSLLGYKTVPRPKMEVVEDEHQWFMENVLSHMCV